MFAYLPARFANLKLVRIQYTLLSFRLRRLYTLPDFSNQIIIYTFHVISLDRSLARSSIARSLDRSLDRALGRSLGRSLARSLDRSLDHSLDPALARSLLHSIACSIAHLIARSMASWRMSGLEHHLRYTGT